MDGRAVAFADGWRAGLTLGTRFDEGVSAGPGGEWVGSMTPQLAFTRRASMARWDIKAGRRFDSRPGDASPRPASDVLGLDVLGTGAVDLELGGRYYRSRDLLSQDPRTAVVPGASESGSGSARISTWRGEVAYEAQTNAHGAFGQADGWSQSASATVYPGRSRRGAWLARGAYREWVLNDVRALSIVTGVAGFRRANTPLLTTEAEVGVVSERDGAGDTKDPGVAWAFGIEGFARALGLPLESRARVGRDVATTGRAEVRRSVAGVGMSVGWTRSLEAEGGHFAVPVTKDHATVGLDDSLAAGGVVSLEGSYGRTRPRDHGTDRVETFRVSGSVSHSLRPWLSGRATYSYLRQQETGGSRFHRGRAEIALTASFR